MYKKYNKNKARQGRISPKKIDDPKREGDAFELFVKRQCKSDHFVGRSNIFKEHDARNFQEKLHVDFIGWTRVFDGKVFYTPCGQRTTMVAFDKHTSEIVWKVKV